MSATPTRQLTAPEIHAAIDRLADAIAADLHPENAPLFLSIPNGGNTLTQRLAARLRTVQRSITCGIVDTTFYRDDVAHRPIPDEVTPTNIPVDVNGADILLIDDVLFTGRTIKAALDELFEYGRPASVKLAILIDRGGRRLPFAPDYCGLRLAAAPNEKLQLRLDPTNPARDTLIIRPQLS